MACCILLAALIAQGIAFWQTRGRRLVFVAGSLVTLSLLSWQLTVHWQHLSAIGGEVAAALTDKPALAITEPHHHH